MTLPGLSQDMLQQQFMFAVAVHEGAAQTRRLLGQMQQARQSLLQAARTGGCAKILPSGMLLHCCIHEGLASGDGVWGYVSSFWEGVQAAGACSLFADTMMVSR